MVNSEYVEVMVAEREYGSKNLLQSQMDIISMIKREHIFKELRKKETNLKLELKRKIDEALNEIDILEKTLPKAKLEEKKEEAKIKKEMQKAPLISKAQKRSVLDEELARIKRKLAKLQ